MRLLLACAMALALIPASANAEWFEVRTDHFVLTIDDTQENARAFAERLERFDSALRRLYAVPDDPDQHLRPLAVYAFDQHLFQKVCGCEIALGYYQERVRQSLVFTMHMPSKVDKKAKEGGWSSQMILLHEYSHHFAFSNFPIAYPKWFSEGFAEFNATAEFAPDGSVLIGYPANYRANAILEGKLPVWDLFDADQDGVSLNDIDAFYGEGWLLTHYLMLSPNRQGQLARYLDVINRGASGRNAATIAFGDLNVLNTELYKYSKGALAPRLKVPPSNAPISVSIRQLSPGETEILPIYAEALSGASKGRTNSLAEKAEAVAKRYPGDPVVQSKLAEMELSAGRLPNAVQSADDALRTKPHMIDPLVVKGMAAVDALSKSKSKDPQSWKAARAWYLDANHDDPNAVMPLYEYYASFVRQEVTPPEDAVKGLMRAEVLAPESTVIRGALARQDLLSGDAHAARALLAPIAYSPHASKEKNFPLQVVQLIDGGHIEDAKALVLSKEKEDAGKSN